MHDGALPGVRYGPPFSMSATPTDHDAPLSPTASSADQPQPRPKAPPERFAQQPLPIPPQPAEAMDPADAERQRLERIAINTERMNELEAAQPHAEPDAGGTVLPTR